MAPTGSSQQPPGSATPEEEALRDVAPDAGAYVDAVSYGQPDVAAVTVSFPGDGPSLTRLVRRHGENDWRPEPQIWLPVELDPKRDLAEQLLGQTFGPATVTGAKGSRGTSADGSDVYQLEVELRVSPPFPVNLKDLRDYVVSYRLNAGVRVAMRMRPCED